MKIYKAVHRIPGAENDGKFVGWMAYRQYELGATTEQENAENPLLGFRTLEDAKEFLRLCGAPGTGHVILECDAIEAPRLGCFDRFAFPGTPELRELLGRTVFCSRVAPLRALIMNVGLFSIQEAQAITKGG